MSKYTHIIPSGIVDASADEITKFCEDVLAQSHAIVAGDISLSDFVEDRLDALERHSKKMGTRHHSSHHVSRAARRVSLLRDIPKTARAVVHYEQAWWIDVHDSEHCMVGVTMVPDIRSGRVVMPYKTFPDLSEKYPSAYSPVFPSSHPVVPLI